MKETVKDKTSSPYQKSELMNSDIPYYENYVDYIEGLLKK